MKEPRYHAWISWLPPKKGGREQVPTGLYWMDARFEKQANWPGEGWTLIVRPTQLFKRDLLQIADVDFVVDDAPYELMTAGARFELLDGRRVVAHGLVVAANATVDVSPQAVEEVLLV